MTAQPETSETLAALRTRHPRFIYRSYHLSRSGDALKIGFEFETEPGIIFHPDLTIPGIAPSTWEQCPPEVLNNLAFHLGLMEIPSYWKATCSPEIVVEAGPLDEWQRTWWTDLLINGMTEFFYVNRIPFTAPDFVTIRASHPGTAAPPIWPRDAQRSGSPGRILVPIGGGKDSIVTIETLKKHAVPFGCFSLNPMGAARDIVRVSGCRADHVITRRIDDTLLRLNAEGYLNGHTPFSALIAFLSVTSAVLLGYRRVAVSYERSSNEGNVSYCGREINHQYAKTFEFEQKFRAYAATYLAPDVDFFSFLRPLYELQIARLFARLTPYHAIFRSCNRGLKQNVWCHNCPKCLFVYAALFPFLEPDAMRTIFSEDLFAREDLAQTAFQLLNLAEQKPFECVGAFEENIAAFDLSIRKLRAAGQPLPPLLRLVEAQILRNGTDPADLADPTDHGWRVHPLLTSWNEQHALPEELAGWLRAELDEASQ
ncbi:MAG: hypothetical protein HC884_00405 [Chloroflexaceae bacterium]|nr:hypothetical protein [Chloroflexaceae bacterium]